MKINKNGDKIKKYFLTTIIQADFSKNAKDCNVRMIYIKILLAFNFLPYNPHTNSSRMLNSSSGRAAVFLRVAKPSTKFGSCRSKPFPTCFLSLCEETRQIIIACEGMKSGSTSLCYSGQSHESSGINCQVSDLPLSKKTFSLNLNKC